MAGICFICEYDLRGNEGFYKIFEVESRYSEEIDNYVDVIHETYNFCSGNCLRRWVE